VGEQADNARRREGDEQVARCEADRERHQECSQIRGNEAARAKQSEIHPLTIGIRDGRD
jgi:hypothetical protein